jgi:hypothetical protein
LLSDSLSSATPTPTAPGIARLAVVSMLLAVAFALPAVLATGSKLA